MRMLFFFCVLIPYIAHAEVTQFVSNGCTLFPEGTRAEPRKWEHCCVEHDLFFWAGGTKAQRDLADIGLRNCVAATGERNIARLMYSGVRAGYRSPIRLGKQGWGNAWQGTRVAYSQLSEVETLEILQGLELQDPGVSDSLYAKFQAALMARLSENLIWKNELNQ